MIPHLHLDVAKLAVARYPCKPVDLAIVFFMSDRRSAGLGALDERKRQRRPSQRVRCVKRLDLERGDIFYDRIIDVPPLQSLDIPEWPPALDDAPEYVTIRTTPARFAHRCVRVPARSFEHQRDRDFVAACLRELRRQTLSEQKTASGA